MKRRDFMRTAGGATIAAGATAGAAQPAAAAGGGGDDGGGEEVPDYGSYLDDAAGFDGSNVTDARGEDELTIAVGGGSGGHAFEPAAVWVSPGTTIVWEWTGEGGAHNVVPEEGPAGFEHEDTVSDEGYTFEYEVTEEDAGITTYKCTPHEQQGMKGGVAVGDDVETISVSADMKEPEEFGVDIHEHWVGVTVILMMVVSLVFTFFMLKYGESPHTSGGD